MMANGTNNKIKGKEAGKVFMLIYKQLLAIIIPLLVSFSTLADDLYYYGAAFASLILIILSFYDLVKEHNLIVSNKLPQFDERGGDKNE